MTVFDFFIILGDWWRCHRGKRRNALQVCNLAAKYFEFKGTRFSVFMSWKHIWGLINISSCRRMWFEFTCDVWIVSFFDCRKVFSQLGKHPGIRILGSQTISRLPIISMLLYNPQSGRYLHHNFVSVILNDLYGIQVRSGCACAGPYAMVSDLFSLKKSKTRPMNSKLTQYMQMSY